MYVRAKEHENRMLNRRRWNNNNSAVHMRQSYRLSEQEKTILSFYEAQCAAQIKKRQSIVFDNGSVVPDQKFNVPIASPAVVAELTKWVKITLSRKKKFAAIAGDVVFHNGVASSVSFSLAKSAAWQESFAMPDT